MRAIRIARDALRYLSEIIASRQRQLEIYNIGGPLPGVTFQREKDDLKILTELRALVEDKSKESEEGPVLIERENPFPSGAGLFLYKGGLYTISDAGLTAEQGILLILDLCQKEDKKFDRIRAEISRKTSGEPEHARPPIPEDVKFAVWRRDEGKCVQCGSAENLEFDHIIPLSKGGSNTVRNLQLLCENCNRSKSAHI